jgi:predicted HTH domain antitoxin
MSSVTMTESWPLEQLVKLQRSQPHVVQRALQRLLDEDEELRWSVVVNAYLDQEISLARAAALLGLHPLVLRERFVNKGIPLRLGPADKADAQAEVYALRVWKRQD